MHKANKISLTHSWWNVENLLKITEGLYNTGSNDLKLCQTSPFLKIISLSFSAKQVSRLNSVPSTPDCHVFHIKRMLMIGFIFFPRKTKITNSLSFQMKKIFRIFFFFSNQTVLFLRWNLETSVLFSLFFLNIELWIVIKWLKESAWCIILVLVWQS